MFNPAQPFHITKFLPKFVKDAGKFKNNIPMPGLISKTLPTRLSEYVILMYRLKPLMAFKKMEEICIRMVNNKNEISPQKRD